MSGELAFPWEREAMRGEEMPEGLSFPDQMAYTTLRNVYQAYYNKIISRDVAAAEKGRLKYQYERAVRQMNFDIQSPVVMPLASWEIFHLGEAYIPPRVPKP